MTLQRKLLIAFGGLAALAILAAGVTIYVTLRWHSTTQQIQTHYLRSLLLQRVRADTFRALAEVNDALAGDPADLADARQDYEHAIAPTNESFDEWSSLADVSSEVDEIAEVRGVYEGLTKNALRVFDLIAADRRGEAVRLADDELDTGHYTAFQELTERAVAADRKKREDVVATADDLRSTAQIMAAVSMIAALSLTLLIAAYLTQDLFRPLETMREGLEALGRGETDKRINADRSDEFGTAAAAFNQAADAIAERERIALIGMSPGMEGGTADWRKTPSNFTLQRLVALLHARLAEARASRADDDRHLDDVEAAASAIGRFASIGFPLDLRLAPLDPRTLVQEVFARFGPAFAIRGVSCELILEPHAVRILADRLKLGEALEEALRHAMAALPEVGGMVGMRVIHDVKAGRLNIDIADSGHGFEVDALTSIASSNQTNQSYGKNTGLGMTNDIVKQHAGDLKIFSKTAQGTAIRIQLPIITS